jgi:hypothetical protein
MGDICSPDTLDNFGDRISEDCLSACEEFPEQFDREEVVCVEINSAACEAQPLLDLVCDCP